MSAVPGSGELAPQLLDLFSSVLVRTVRELNAVRDSSGALSVPVLNDAALLATVSSVSKGVVASVLAPSSGVFC